MTRRHYSDRDRAAALAVYDAEAAGKGRETRAANAAGVPLTTLREWLSDRDRAAPAELRNETTEALGEVFNRVARKALQQAEGALEGDADPARLKDYMVAAAIATDKEQLLAGMPTSRVANMTEGERKATIAKILELAERQERVA